MRELGSTNQQSASVREGTGHGAIITRRIMAFPSSLLMTSTGWPFPSRESSGGASGSAHLRRLGFALVGLKKFA
jgi:hypothetical protein